MTRAIGLGFALLALAAGPASAAVSLPAVLGEHMVVQRERPLHLWGQAEPGETVTAGFRGDSRRAVADELGRWSLHLPPSGAGGPFTLDRERVEHDPARRRLGGRRVGRRGPVEHGVATRRRGGRARRGPAGRPPPGPLPAGDAGHVALPARGRRDRGLEGLHPADRAEGLGGGLLLRARRPPASPGAGGTHRRVLGRCAARRVHPAHDARGRPGAAAGHPPLVAHGRPARDDAARGREGEAGPSRRPPRRRGRGARSRHGRGGARASRPGRRRGSTTR